MDSTVSNAIVGFMLGIVMYRSRCHVDAPSTLAASYSSFGIDWSPTSSTTTWKPMNFHTTNAMTVSRALVGVLRKPTGLLVTLADSRILLKTPSRSCASTHHISDAAAAPTTYGRKNAVRY